MKKAIIFTGIVLILMSCGDSSNSTTTTDSLGISPGAIEEGTQHPTGVTNQNVISTDTAAMNVEKMSDSSGN